MQMDQTSQLRVELTRWLTQVREASALGTHESDWRPLAGLPAWPCVRNCVSALAPPERRDDLYAADGSLRDETLLYLSGLSRVAHAVGHGADIDDDQVAARFSTFCTAPRPASEDWLLLDGQAPAGTDIPLGEYTLRTLRRDELRHLRPPLHSITGSVEEAPAAENVLDGALVLQRTVNERALVNGYRFPLMGMHTRPELLHWRPLLTLLLWSSNMLRMNAWFIVERERRADLHAGTVPVVPDIHVDDTGREIEYERRDTGLWRVTKMDLPRLNAFATAVDGLISTVLAGADQKSKRAKMRARRLQRASEHLVRAAHRTYGNDFVWEDDADEVTLHYVIALEALLADEEQADLSRKVKQRAAALWMTDSHRLAVAQVVGRAYGRRSKYAHGDETGDADTKELHQLRRVAHSTLLRWLVTTVSTGPDLPLELDKTLLSDELRTSTVTAPLRSFYEATPPVRLPADLLSS
ncbi:hypothetical protein GCM10019016_038120 [Streptomyces prasinosporus]|uniref:Apea-like HEPN domain-containing protein n=1 Tax=Streptomyces prasinosporus TaxID=68256 RepID=A0ABP6TQK6_9ACTN